MSHIWMSHITYANESCHTYKWVMSNEWMSHVTHVQKTQHTAHITHTRTGGTPSAQKDWVVRVTWLVHMFDMSHFMFDMSHLYVWHDSFICIRYVIYTCNMTHFCCTQGSRLLREKLSFMCQTTHLYVWHVWFIYICEVHSLYL